MARRPDVVVVGAGVIGLTTAVRLAEEGLTVRVMASQPSPGTSSAVAGAILAGPVFADPVDAATRWPPIESTAGWHRTSLDAFEAMAAQPRTGVRIARGRMVSQADLGVQPWMRRLPGFRPCAAAERAGFAVAFWMCLPLVDMPRYLDYLTGRLIAAGGRTELRRVALLDEVSEADVTVNCAGVGARHLADDPLVFPVRGQHVVVANPGLTDFLFEFYPGSTLTSYLPHSGRVVLGGTMQRDNWSREPDAAQTEAILGRCIAVEPRLAGARILDVVVGLRAARPRIRLEEEVGGSTRIIHNYGHGAVGVGLSWGCAAEVARLVRGEVRA